MPLVQVRLIENVFSAQQKEQMIKKLTDAMVSIEGENLRGVTWVTIEEVRSGGSFYSQNDLRVHFGLGKATRIDKLEIRWPSDQIDRFADVPANQILQVDEPVPSGSH